jgi:hypothetical protein
VFIEERREFEQGQSRIIQGNQAVESRNLLDKSEGQPSKPAFTVRADAIFALNYPSCGEPALVHADGDDPLVKQEMMSQLNCEEPKSLLRKEQGHAVSLDQSSLCPNTRTDIQVCKLGRFVGCSIVRCEPQTSKNQERQVRLRDCERYLKQDSRFWWATDQMRFCGPGTERNKLVDEFWNTAYSSFYLSERDLIRARGRVLSEYVALLDEEYGRRGLECERFYGPSHVEDGGGDSLQADQEDRSSPVQSQRSGAL